MESADKLVSLFFWFSMSVTGMYMLMQVLVYINTFLGINVIDLPQV